MSPLCFLIHYHEKPQMAVTALGSVEFLLSPLVEVYPVVKESLKLQGQEMLPLSGSETCELCLTETWHHIMATGSQQFYPFNRDRKEILQKPM